MDKETVSRITKEYEAMLSIPSIMPPKQFLLCPVGLVGAGKTTVVKPLAEMLSLVRISGDEVRKLLKENELNYERVYEIGEYLVKKYIEKGHSVAIDTDCASEHTRKLIADITQKYGITSVWIHINPPEEFIIDKLKHFKHTWLFESPEAALKNYFDRKSLHEKLDMGFVYTFDTSRNDLSEQTKEARKAIQEYLQK